MRGLQIEILLVVVTAGFLSAATSCSSPGRLRPNGPENDSDIYLIGSADYHEKANAFRISAQEARRRAEQYVEVNGPGDVGHPIYHLFIVGEEYVFVPTYDKLGVHVYGYFVNGHTGNIDVKEWNLRVVHFARFPGLQDAVAAEDERRRNLRNLTHENEP